MIDSDEAVTRPIAIRCGSGEAELADEQLQPSLNRRREVTSGRLNPSAALSILMPGEG
jgi:hypothetical protein